jgi:hypothetical protein
MSLDHEPLGDMGARGPVQEPCLVAMAQQGNTDRPVAGELCDGASPFRFSVMDVHRCACGITARRLLPQGECGRETDLLARVRGGRLTGTR